MNELLLKKELYHISTINSAVVAYLNLADIELTYDNEYYRLVFEHCKYPISKTVKEFENYVIQVESNSL